MDKDCKVLKVWNCTSEMSTHKELVFEFHKPQGVFESHLITLKKNLIQIINYMYVQLTNSNSIKGTNIFFDAK